MRIVFMGTPEFAVPSLKALIREEYEVAGVFCQPDRPKGRGHKLAMCPVKEEALRAKLPVFQPEKIKSPEGVAALRSLEPDLCVTAAFGQLLSQEILDIPRHGTINVHASLLPRHRGSAPIHYSIICGDKETGITTMMTDIGMDTGDILMRTRTRISDEDTAGSLAEKLAVLGAEVLMETLAAIRLGTLERKPQDSGRATYEPKLTRETGRIDWKANARTIDCLVRGTDPWPGAFTLITGETMKVFGVKALEETADAAPGTIVAADRKTGLIVACGDRNIEVTELQMPGQKRMSARDYLLGHKVEVGLLLGE